MDKSDLSRMCQRRTFEFNIRWNLPTQYSLSHTFAMRRNMWKTTRARKLECSFPRPTPTFFAYRECELLIVYNNLMSHQLMTLSIAFDASNKLVASSGFNGRVHIWNQTDAKAIRSFFALPGYEVVGPTEISSEKSLKEK